MARPIFEKRAILLKMETGKYQKEKDKVIDFTKYSVDKFPLHLWDNTIYKYVSCGANALGLLTGFDPINLDTSHNKIYKSDHYSDDFMINLLRVEKFQVIKLTKANLTNPPQIGYPIKSNHILLVSQLFAKQIASWSVLWNDLIFHNFEVKKLMPFDFLNWPILSAYVLFKKGWRRK